MKFFRFWTTTVAVGAASIGTGIAVALLSGHAPVQAQQPAPDLSFQRIRDHQTGFAYLSPRDYEWMDLTIGVVKEIEARSKKKQPLNLLNQGIFSGILQEESHWNTPRAHLLRRSAQCRP